MVDQHTEERVCIRELQAEIASLKDALREEKIKMCKVIALMEESVHGHEANIRKAREIAG